MADAAVERERIAWIDTARGAAIYLVVLSHTAKILLFVMPDLAYRQVLEGATRPMVLGLFFLSSGLLGARTMQDPRRAVGRVIGIGWLMIVWVLILGLWLAWAMPRGYGGAVRSPADYVAELAAPDSPAWFLLALATCTVYGVLAYRFGLAAGIALAVLLSLATLSNKLPGLNYGWSQTFINLPLFLVAPLLMRRVPSLNNPPARTAFAMLVGGIALAIPLYAYGFDNWGLRRGIAVFAGMWPATIAALGALSLLSGFAPVRAVVAWTGKRTLAILVLHILFLTLLVPAGLELLPEISFWPVLSLLLICAAIACVLSLLSAALLIRLRLSIFFLPPGPLRSRVTGSIGGVRIRQNPAVPVPARADAKPGKASRLMPSDRWFRPLSRRLRGRVPDPEID